jgi:hypothetical protein
MSLIGLLITVVPFAVIVYLLFWVLGYLAVPEPIRKVAVVVVVLIAVVWILANFLPGQHGVFLPR